MEYNQWQKKCKIAQINIHELITYPRKKGGNTLKETILIKNIKPHAWSMKSGNLFFFCCEDSNRRNKHGLKPYNETMDY